MRKALARAAVAFAFALDSAGVLAAPPILVPGASHPGSVDALGSLDGAQALGLSGDLALAAAAIPSTHDAQRSVLRVARAGESPRDVLLPGSVVALAVADSGDSVLVAMRDLGKKGEILGVRLLRFDVSTMKVSASVPLPATTRGLAFRAGGQAILAASRDELRTFVLPALTSGPMYRVLGDNRGVASLAGGSRVLVAQAARLVLVDLAGSQSREGLPIVEQVALTGPPRSLVSSPDEPAALILGEDGFVSRVEVDPLQLSANGAATALAWPGVPPTPPEAPPAAAAAHSAPAEPESPPPPPAEPPPAEAPAAAAVSVVAAAPESAVPPAPEPPAAPLPSGVLSGRIDGPAASQVTAMVALGPDNILAEAARVRPSPEGGWRIDGLRPGAYRIVAVGDGGGVLICEPPYVSAKVGPETGRESPVMHVLRAAR